MQLDLGPGTIESAQKNINSYLIEQVGRANHMPTVGLVGNVWNQPQHQKRHAEQEIEHLPLLIFPKLHAPPLTPKRNNEGLSDVG